MILVDERAHTNAPGSRHAKRWQDIEELLAAGIEVHTAMNVQHLESLNDLVGKITGVAVRETVPDSAFDRADQVELVDLPAEELIKRLEEGKVYVPDQAAQAIQKFFRPGNLIALRELALRKTAERVDAQMERYRQLHGIAETWPVAERILVAVSSGPGRPGWCGRRAAWRRSCARSGWWSTSKPPPRRSLPEAESGASGRLCGWPRSWARRPRS